MKRALFEEVMKDLPCSFDVDGNGKYRSEVARNAYAGWCAAMKQGAVEGYLLYNEAEPDKHLKMLCLQKPKNIPTGLTLVPLKRKIQ